MAPIKIAKLINFSSEDKNYPSDNLLQKSDYKGWRCATVGEKQAHVTLELDGPSTITSIDIGNNASAFIEVLVGRSGMNDTDFKVLLMASSFMSPAEARSGNNPSRVRMFGSDKLPSEISKERWDRVKIVCTQPFSKSLQYGVTFIKLSGPDKPANKTGGGNVQLGRFSLKAESEDQIAVGELFTRRKNTPPSPAPLTGAAAVRAASTLAAVALANASDVIEKQRKRKHEDGKNPPDPGFYQLKKKAWEDGDSPSNNKNRTIKNKTDVKSLENLTTSRKVANKKRHEEEAHKKDRGNEAEEKMKNKKGEREKNKENDAAKTVVKRKPFQNLLDDVVFVMSGFKNPLRADLRQKAMDMGAKYLSDWNSSSTHLICAFVNTPKFSQVKGKGRIVKKEWVEDCHTYKKRFPWRRYCLDNKDKGPDSEEEVCEGNGKEEDQSDYYVSDEYGASTDVASDDSDTEDEIRRMSEAQSAKKENKHEKIEKEVRRKEEEEDSYDADTDVDEEVVIADESRPDTSHLLVPRLPSYFTGKTFFIYGNMEEYDRRRLVRYITAYDGHIIQYMNDEVQYILSNDDWDSNFDEALESSPALTFIRPRWVLTCHKKRTLVPHQPYLIVPKL